MTTPEEPEAYTDETLRSIGISPRERLARIESLLSKMDEKLDAKFDVLEKRVWALEVNVAPTTRKLEQSLAEHDAKLDLLDARLDTVRTWVWKAIGAVSALLVVLNVGIAKHWF